MSIDIVSAADVDDAELLAVINEAFEREPKSLDWFRWKHREGPWGPSIGSAAVRNGEAVGVRLFVPWVAATPDGNTVSVLRAMDGAVSTTARRQGVFIRLVNWQIQAIEAGDVDASFVYSTSVPASREAYRKIGWSIFDVHEVLKVPRPRLAKLQHHDRAAIPAHVLPDSDRLRTAWDVPSLRWRTDPRSGYDYSVFSLAQSDHPNGIVARRVVSGRIPIAVVTHLWAGDASEEIALLGGLTRAMRCAAVWCVDEPSAQSGLRRSRGTSSISLWAAQSTDRTRYIDRQSWSFSFGDLEGVM